MAFSVFVNADESCVLFGLEKGFKVYDTETQKLLLWRDVGPVTMVRVLSSSNIFAFVGFDKKKLTFWNDETKKRSAEIAFPRVITQFLFGRSKMVVSTDEKTYLYDLETLKLLGGYETTQNPHGSLAVNSDRAQHVFAFPGMKQGYVHIIRNGISLFVKAHEGVLRVLSLNREGNLLATTSEKGTAIRVFDTTSGERVANFRRGKTETKINHISWSKDSKFLCVSSERGTSHVFRMGQNFQNSALSGFLPDPLSDYASSESSWSLARYLHPKGITLVSEGSFLRHFSVDEYVSECIVPENGGEALFLEQRKM
ncbi:conserved WD-repeat containing protein [Tokyovirus A1]|uniref:conserved WD-repeat containing protein n=1 Tax=Tokyovirus A1 TaxID=1826170 RepID=UPI0007A975A8|nr:conserved WD-repeat containing protein [Tokyovirus A1]BAU79957.1 conserved WD-repeat containing protein [Tokyovirus A1]